MVQYINPFQIMKIRSIFNGCVILTKNEVIKFGGADNKEEYLSMRNVAGELLGTIEAIKWANSSYYKIC